MVGQQHAAIALQGLDKNSLWSLTCGNVGSLAESGTVNYWPPDGVGRTDGGIPSQSNDHGQHISKPLQKS